MNPSVFYLGFDTQFAVDRLHNLVSIHTLVALLCVYSWLDKKKHALCWYPHLPSVLQRDVPRSEYMVMSFPSTADSYVQPALKVRITSDCLHQYHWTVLFDSISCTLYVKSNEHCSLDLEAETLPTSVWQ